jgi:acetyl-CoA synthetase
VRRLGVMHSVVFAVLRQPCRAHRRRRAKLVITTDGQYRRGKAVPLKAAVDEAVAGQPTVEHVLVVRRTGIDVDWTEGRDLWWHETVAEASPSTPGGVRLRASAVPALHLRHHRQAQGHHAPRGLPDPGAYTHYNVFDMKPETDVFWCTADIGWVTGHTYIVYGPLSNGATQVVYEGTPSPDEHRHFQVIEKYGVTIYYTAPTAIRTFMKWGRDIAFEHDLSSLRFSARSASRSTPRPGAGTDWSSAATPCRSSTPGGRPRRAPHDQPAARRDTLQARFGDARCPASRPRSSTTTATN